MPSSAGKKKCAYAIRLAIGVAVCATIWVVAACAVDGLTVFACGPRVVSADCAYAVRVVLTGCACARRASDAAAGALPQRALPYLWAGAGAPEPTPLEAYEPHATSVILRATI